MFKNAWLASVWMQASSFEIVVELGKVKRYQDGGEVHHDFCLNVQDKVFVTITMEELSQQG